MAPTRARVVGRGKLSKRLATAFDGMTLIGRHGRTELVGEIVDQAQLHGLLTRIRDLGLELEQLCLSAEETAGQPDPQATSVKKSSAPTSRRRGTRDHAYSGEGGEPGGRNG